MVSFERYLGQAVKDKRFLLLGEREIKDAKKDSRIASWVWCTVGRGLP